MIKRVFYDEAFLVISDKAETTSISKFWDLCGTWYKSFIFFTVVQFII